MRPFRYVGRGDGIDDYLMNLGLWRKTIPDDDTSIYRVVAEQLFQSQALHEDVKRACDSYLSRHSARLSQGWNGPIEIKAMALLFQCDFILYKNAARNPINMTCMGFKKQVLVCLTSTNHYDSIHRRLFMETAALSQSILYELLYERIFGVKNAVAMGQEMIGTKPFYPGRNGPLSPTVGRPLYFNGGDTYNSSTGDGHHQPTLYRFTPFPYKVAKSLSPDMYRNVEFDAWRETQKNEYLARFAPPTMSTAVSPDNMFTPGDKCQIKSDEADDRVLTGHIQELLSENESAVVFILELGERHVVKLNKLVALPQLNAIDGAWRRRGKKKSCDCTRGCNAEHCVGSAGRNRIGSINQNFGTFHRTRINSAGHPLKSSLPEGANTAAFYGAAQNKARSPIKTSFGPRARLFRQRFNSEGQADVFERRSESASNVPASAGYQKTERFSSPTDWRVLADVNGEEHASSDHNGNGSGDAHSCSAAGSDIFLTHPADMNGSAIDYSNSYTAVDLCSPAAVSADMQQMLMPPMCYMTAVPVQGLVIPMADNVTGPINTSVTPSVEPSGHDLPVNDPTTMRYFFNLGVQYFRMTSSMFTSSPPASALLPPTQPCFTYPSVASCPSTSSTVCLTSLPTISTPTGGAIVQGFDEHYATTAPVTEDDYFMGSMACSPMSAVSPTNGSFYFSSHTQTSIASPGPFLQYPALLHHIN